MDLKEWTIMIYMAGDNNLSVDMAYAMEQIKGVAGEGPSSPNLFVFYDGNSPDIPTLYCDFSDPKQPRYVPAFSIDDKLIPTPEKVNENAADDRTVINFVDWCLNGVDVHAADGTVSRGRRAKRYAMIFSGHSLGFQDIGLFRDETSGRAMKMRDLFFLLQRLTSTEAELKADAANQGFSDAEYERVTKPLIGQKLDILGFDSCVMGMLEVGYQFSGVAKTMIASEGSVPNAGWTYAKILACLAQENTGHCDASVVGEHFVRQFIKSQDAYTVGGISVDMAAWDLDSLQPLALAFDQLACNLIYSIEDPQSLVYKQMERAILNVHWRCQSYMYDQNVDLGDFCELLAAECTYILDDLGSDDEALVRDIRTSCESILEKLGKAVILSGFSGGGYQYSNGISVFFPWSREGYEVSRKNYEELWFVKDIGRDKTLSWPGFLRRYLREVARRKFQEPAEPQAGKKFRYYSGFPFAHLNGGVGPGEANGKLAGEKASKLAGEKASKLAGEKASKLAGEKASKLAGEKASKLAGEKALKLAGEKASKLAGETASKLAGEKASKLAGEKGSKLAGGGSGSSQFFDNLRLFKNIESRWNISGFSKPPREYTTQTEAGDNGPTQA